MSKWLWSGALILHLLISAPIMVSYPNTFIVIIGIIILFVLMVKTIKIWFKEYLKN